MKNKAKHKQPSTSRVETPSPDVGATQEWIRRRAYELWEQAGREHGRDAEHWLQAEWEVRQQTKITRR